jgi:hypothetical protein
MYTVLEIATRTEVPQAVGNVVLQDVKDLTMDTLWV